MTKRLFSMLLVCVMLITACLTAIPTFEAFATFKNGEVVIITDRAGGSVSPEGVVGTDYPTYFVSAMEATNAEKTANYFAWCASYGVATPPVGKA